MDALWSPGSCLAITLMTAFAVLFRAEISRHKAAALHYLAFYWIASTCYAVFVVFALEVPGFAGKLGRCASYLIFSTAILIIGLLLHRRSAQSRCVNEGPQRTTSREASLRLTQ